MYEETSAVRTRGNVKTRGTTEAVKTMTRSTIYTTVSEGLGLLLKEVSPSLYYVVDTPLVILRLPFGGWQVVYYDHGKRVPCFSGPRASLELAAQDAFRVLEITRSMAMKLPILPHPTPEAAQSLVKPMERPATLLPTLVDEQRMVDIVAAAVEKVFHRLEKEFSLEWLATVTRKWLREGRQPFTDYTVRLADGGDEICDAALRYVNVEVQTGALPERREGHAAILIYGLRAVQRAPHKPRGRRWQERWMRDIQICRLIEFACYECGVWPTRNRAAYDRARRGIPTTPSGCSLVVSALARHGFHLDEGRVQNIWLGLPGEIVKLYAAPSAPPLGRGK
jgi:hypothetical protein